MELPSSLIEELVEEKRIYFFKDNSPIGVQGHMHICIKKENKMLLFSTCTSQQDTVLKLHRYKGADLNSFPCFIMDDINKFDVRETYVNCNNIITCDIHEFSEYISDGYIVRFDGCLTDDDMDLISKGVLCSDMISQEIKDLFR